MYFGRPPPFLVRRDPLGLVPPWACAKVLAGRAIFASLHCSVCGEPARSYAAKTKVMTCRRGHMTAARPGTSRAPSTEAAGPAAAPVRGGGSPLASLSPPAPLPGNVGELEVRGLLGPSAGGNLTAETFKARGHELLARGARAVLLTLNSAGGDVQTALEMALHLRGLAAKGVPVVAYVPAGGLAGSAATFPFLAADVAVLDPGSDLPPGSRRPPV